MAATTLTYDDRKINSSNNGSNTAARSNRISSKIAELSPSIGSWSTRRWVYVNTTITYHIFSFFSNVLLMCISVYLSLTHSTYFRLSHIGLLFFLQQILHLFSLFLSLSIFPPLHPSFLFAFLHPHVRHTRWRAAARACSNHAARRPLTRPALRAWPGRGRGGEEDVGGALWREWFSEMPERCPWPRRSGRVLFSGSERIEGRGWGRKRLIKRIMISVNRILRIVLIVLVSINTIINNASINSCSNSGNNDDSNTGGHYKHNNNDSHYGN